MKASLCVLGFVIGFGAFVAGYSQGSIHGHAVCDARNDSLRADAERALWRIQVCEDAVTYAHKHNEPVNPLCNVIELK